MSRLNILNYEFECYELYVLRNKYSDLDQHAINSSISIRVS